MSTELQTLRWQFNLACRLAQHHVPALTDEACLWEPAPGSWSVRKSADGVWHHDWADAEPSIPPPVTIGWLTWHLIWWWSGLIATMRNEKAAAHNEMAWPGSAEGVKQRLATLTAEWTEILAKLSDDDLERPFAYPWAEPRPLRIALAWANSELMKNVAEIGCVRHLFEAGRTGVRNRIG